eukprot:TRINITY_DN16216_c0_g1_i3.p1 TRINITY_DN16216_c0_g1~~TRINITY_DN16216_c0_g1_i3.p1  ORF type:complete len:783 (+),score=196.71 TRINITY_DN16216_c0_g1_i3:323-2350(+)
MRVDFKSMEEEMDQLAESMSSITRFSNQISEKLRSRRQEVASLSATHSTLQKLECVLELPDRLKESVQEEEYTKAIHHWNKANASLKYYRDMPSFAGIQEDCEEIICLIQHKLEQRLQDPDVSAEQLSESVRLLQELGNPADNLIQTFLAHEAVKLDKSLEVLRAQVHLCQDPTKVNADSVVLMDSLEFIDEACNGFVPILADTATLFYQLFADHQGGEVILNDWITEHLEEYLNIVKTRLSLDKEERESVILVRALDRFYKKLSAATRNLPGLDTCQASLNVVLAVTEACVDATAANMEAELRENVLAARQAIAAPRTRMPPPAEGAVNSGGGAVAPPGAATSGINLIEMVNSLQDQIVDSLKTALGRLKMFTDPELTFSVKSGFRSRFSRDLIWNSIFFKQFWFIRDTCHKFTGDVTVPPALLLLLSRTCLDLHVSTIPFLATYTQDEFGLSESPNLSKICTSMASTSQLLLERYVQVESGDLSVLLGKSVEARDWLSSVEPRSVRAVMKRIVEDVNLIDSQVGQLYEEGNKKPRSGESTRRLGGASRARSVFSNYGNLDSSLATNIQKLFSERIDFFTPVKPTKVSVLTLIIKLGLKTLLECVRLKTFSKYGLQQIQVDCHYLQLHLWKFVQDEDVVHHLLDEIMYSAVLRSLHQPPVLMEASVVEVICDKV